MSCVLHPHRKATSTRYLALVLCCLVVPKLLAQTDTREARNTESLRRYAELGKQGAHDQQAAFWSRDAVNNGRPMKPEMIGLILEDIHRTFPDYHSEAVETRAIGDTVVTLSRVSGTHRGVARTNFNGGLLQGAKPTGKRFEVLSTHWWRFDDAGRIVWHQATRDDLGMMRQLGLIPDRLPDELLVEPSD